MVGGVKIGEMVGGVFGGGRGGQNKVVGGVKIWRNGRGGSSRVVGGVIDGGRGGQNLGKW